MLGFTRLGQHSEKRSNPSIQRSCGLSTSQKEYVLIARKWTNTASTHCKPLQTIALVLVCRCGIWEHEERPRPRYSGPHALLASCPLQGLPDAYYFLDLLSQWLLLLLSPTIMLLLPVAGFLFHQPFVGDPACLSFEVTVFARVAHQRIPPSHSNASVAHFNRFVSQVPSKIIQFCNVWQHPETGVGGMWLRRSRVGAIGSDVRL